MSPEPTGRVTRTDRGLDLVIEREFDAPISEVWASLTESERTAQWFGPWSGRGAPGETIEVTMSAEEGAPSSPARIEACESPRHLRIAMDDSHGSWLLEAELAERGGRTTLTFTQHLKDDAGTGSIGPGWEYYLDRLVAARDGSPMPEFGDYYPAQKAYYEAAAGAA
jgi:uncharacterized protein YndB with AHSA1/START domain